VPSTLGWDMVIQPASGKFQDSQTSSECGGGISNYDEVLFTKAGAQLDVLAVTALHKSRFPISFLWRFLRVALNALKHRDVPKVDRMSERLVSFVATLALHFGQAAKIHRMLIRPQFY